MENKVAGVGRKEMVVAEYLCGDRSLREVAARYGMRSSTIHRWVQEAEGVKPEKRKKVVRGEGGRALVTAEDIREAGEYLPGEVKRLREELRRERLHTKLLNAMIDIAEEEMGVTIRKKSGGGQ